ncbi:MAG: hypothetical protein N3D79_04960 [Acidilobaceae archaeon]|nr:hypothetical protein [Acidilobaceae archaeon]
MEKDVKKLLLFAFLLRIAVAPFSAHLWDMAMIQESLYLTLQGESVYSYVYEKSVKLQNATGLPLFFEGYAYPPHLTCFLFPFYLLYLSLGGDPRPIKIESNAALSLVPEEGFVASLDVFLFLAIIKLPLLLADLIIVYLLSRRSMEIATVYAFSPYALIISAAWGMFDGLVGLFLLLALILAERGMPFLSGFSFGLSMVKPYSLFALPPFLFYFYRHNIGALAKFSLGFLAGQLPTFAPLLLSPQEFLYTSFLFHGLRNPSGMTPLRALVVAEDSHLASALLSAYSVLFLFSYLLLLFLMFRRGTNLPEGVLVTMSFFLGFNKVIHEQYFLSLFPLLLLYHQKRARTMELLYLTYTILNSALYLLTLPLLFVMDYEVLSLKYEATHYGLGALAMGALVPTVFFAFSVINVLMNLKTIMEFLSGEMVCEKSRAL